MGNPDHIRVTVDDWSVTIHDTNRDDVDWPVLWIAGGRSGPSKASIALAHQVAQAVRARIDEYEQAAEQGHHDASEMVAACERVCEECAGDAMEEGRRPTPAEISTNDAATVARHIAKAKGER